MGKRGRKSPFNEKIQATIIRLVEAGKTEEEIAEIIGVCKTTLTNWKGKHQDLLFAVREARQAADSLVESALFGRAVGCKVPETKVIVTKLGDVIREDVDRYYPPDTQAAMFWLRNRQPERWKEKTEGDVNVNQTVQVNNMTPEQKKARIDELIAKRRG